MYKKGLSGVLKHWDFVLIDLISLHIAFIIACLIRQGAEFNPYPSDVYVSVAIITEGACVIGIFLLETMKNILKRGFWKEVRTSIIQSLTVLMLTSLFLFSMKAGEMFSRIILYLTVAIYGVLSLGLRCLWKKVLLKRRRLDARRLLVISPENTAADTLKRLSGSKTEKYNICALACPDGCDKKTIEGIPVITGNESDISEYICREWVDEVFITADGGYAVHEKLINDLIGMGITVHYCVPEIGGGSADKRIVEKIGGYTVVTSSIRTVKTGQLFIKRCMDILGGIVGCILTGIIFIFLAPAIKIQSPGKIFFAQERIGRNGKRFRMYKFRSMHTDAEERKKELAAQNRVADGMMFKLDFDPRIIGSRIMPDGTVKKGLGNFIRETSLDEFPQFFNVLRGDMSLVGTRPPTPDEWEKYDPRHRARMSVKPGITGLWQVSGRSSITDFEEVVRLDKKYITEWSVMLDIKILLKTIAVVFGKKGSL